MSVSGDVRRDDQTVSSVSFKFVSTIFYQIWIFSPKDSPLKTMKNVFHFI